MRRYRLICRVRPSSAIRIACILCGDCVRVCQEVQGIGVLDFAFRGAKTVVTPAFGKDMADVECVNCGQCVAVCPTGALIVKSETEKAWEAIYDDSKVVIAQIAPAVRVSIGEIFGMNPGEISLGKLVTALRMLGFDKVFDTSFAADLTAIEETAEFIGRLQNKERLPQFTSCCPAWVTYAEQYHPGTAAEPVELPFSAADVRFIGQAVLRP